MMVHFFFLFKHQFLEKCYYVLIQSTNYFRSLKEYSNIDSQETDPQFHVIISISLYDR